MNEAGDDSLPVPDSPVTRTVVSVAATWVGLFEHVVPAIGVADDAEVGARLELPGEDLNAGLRGGRAGARVSAICGRRWRVARGRRRGQ